VDPAVRTFSIATARRLRPEPVAHTGPAADRLYDI